ncbi:Glycosyltransferase involved in cell wall bisynthesis [Mariniphaga anaerophila]|uniref:Glycosyltransferase involved in cell wall bisynthesis n=1 Tax=Mariniphaga anaerophila TaxID=1484053 RepID=A0A1M4VL70_9BACT|nr:glycosyltransferase family 4 protein [Mariniphaga anaerophila]SHE69562.1 Glycosyltransferase involved in cell wall bisynthesis [Mariniphaga anaerophila]
MKITHIIYSLNTGGTETMLVDIANEQAKTEDVSVIIVNKSINEYIAGKFHDGIKTYRIEREPGSRNPLKLVKFNLLLKEINPDVIHCHNHTLINLIKWPLKGVKYLTVHALNYPIVNFNKYDKLFAISESVKKDILSKGNYKVQVVYNGIHTELITQKKHFKPDAPFKIIQVSRLNHTQKGQHILIEALSLIKKNNPKLQFTADFIGEGESLDYLKKLVDKNDLSQNIRFWGNQTRSFVYQNLHKYDLLVQPSLFEGFGLTVAEAMAAKVPVLVSNINGPMEIIGNGEYGAYFKSEKIDDCADKIERIIKKYEFQKITTLKAYNYCFANFSIESTSEKYLNNY